MNRYTAILLALLMAVLSILPVSLAEEAPAETTQPTETAETAETAETVEAATEDQVLATVSDGTVIMQSTIDADYNKYINQFQTYYGPNSLTENDLHAIYQMSFYTYLEELFVKFKKTEFPEEELSSIEHEANELYENVIAQITTYYGLEPAEDATDEDKAAARSQAMTIASYNGYELDSIIENLLINKIVNNLVGDFSISEEDIIAAYNERVEIDKAAYEEDPTGYTKEYANGGDCYFVPAGFRGITHILLEVDEDLLSTYQDLQNRYEESSEPIEYAEEVSVEAIETKEEVPTDNENTESEEATEEPVTEEQVENARQAIIASVQETIDEIYAKLESGTPWADLVAEYSIDPGMSQEPYKTNGYEVYADSTGYDPAFMQAAFSIDNVGDVSEPYVGIFGVYIVHYTRDVPSAPVEFTEEIHNALEEELDFNYKQSTYNNAFFDWVNSNIQFSELGESYRLEDTDTSVEDMSDDQ